MQKTWPKQRILMRLCKRDFLNLVDCPLTQDEYLRILRQVGLIAG